MLIFLIAILSILLIIIIIIQNPQKKGINNEFIESKKINTIGFRRANNLIEKTTWILCITIFILSMSSAFFLEKKHKMPKIKNKILIK